MSGCITDDVLLRHEVGYAERNTKEAVYGLEDLTLREKRHYPVGEGNSCWYIEVHPKRVACLRQDEEGLIEKKQASNQCFAYLDLDSGSRRRA